MDVPVVKQNSLVENIWIYIKINPNIELSVLENSIVANKQTTLNTVKTLLTTMLQSGVIVKTLFNKNKVLNICQKFCDSKQVSIYVNLYKKYDLYKDNNNLSGFFLDTELDKINNLRIELFVKTGNYYQFERLTMYLIKYHEKNNTEMSLIKPTVSTSASIDYKSKPLSITFIEKQTPMEKLLNFFSSMKFSYP